MKTAPQEPTVITAPKMSHFWAISGHFVNHITSSALRGDGMMPTACGILLF
jgi:hypothetical protein